MEIQACMDLAVRICVVPKEQDGQKNELRQCLCIVDAILLQILLERNEAFALNDSELGETDVVQHSINMNGAPPVKTSSCCILYAKCREL